MSLPSPQPSGNFLALDRGNSRIKAMVYAKRSGVNPEMVCGFEDDFEENIISLIETHNISEGAMVSVGRPDVRLIETLRRLLPDSFLYVTHRTPLPITIDYHPVESLGLDRVVAAVGASQLAPGKNCLIIDAGTAVTIDMVDSEGVFRGGTISPGYEMALKAMHAFTAKLPQLSPDEKVDPDPFPKSTQGAMQRGAAVTVFASVAHALLQARQLNDCTVIMTGGAAHRLKEWLDNSCFHPLLSELPGIEIKLLPGLIGFGLQKIYEYNVKNP